MSNTVAQPEAINLRNLYFTRTFVQLLWAGIVLATAVSNPAAAAGLLILYPLWDVACTLYDIRTSARTSHRAPVGQYVNAALGMLAAAAIAATVFHSPQQAVAAFGVWALAAGLAQLAVGIARRAQLGGQWAMILSGVQSAAAGAFFILGGLQNTKHIKDLGGYAVFGGVYFLIAGILMQRRLSKTPQTAAI